uniref:Ig-like domain-containing protein n=1 Tax=Esox lucius TaxID=8010 RepID=A0A3P8Z367_ESOLU
PFQHTFQLVLCSTVPLQAIYTQSSSMRLVSANVGETVILRCFQDNLAQHFLWYKQTLGDKPKILSSCYSYANNPEFHNEFKDRSRFSVLCGTGINHLNISDIQLSDSASYYCGSSHTNELNFLVGAILVVKGSESRNTPVVQQPVSESVHPGDSVTLNCTINTETCGGEHSVYWFRHDSGESPPGIIYTNGDRSGQCMKSPESGSPTQSCVYNLPKRNLSLSDTGTYYCAVASCGEILFGNGTKLDVGGNYTEPVLSVYCLGVALGVSIILIIVLICIIYKMNLMTLLCSSQNQDADNIHYVALNLNKKRSSRQRSNMQEETVVVYAGIRQ